MLLKKILQALIVTVFLSSSAYAAGGWINGRIVQVATSDSSAWLVFTTTDGSVTNVPFLLSTTNTNTLLATALTAQSADKAAFIYVSDTTPNSVCVAVAIQN